MPSDCGGLMAMPSDCGGPTAMPSDCGGSTAMPSDCGGPTACAHALSCVAPAHPHARALHFCVCARVCVRRCALEMRDGLSVRKLAALERASTRSEELLTPMDIYTYLY